MSPAAARRQQRERDGIQKPSVIESDEGLEDAEMGGRIIPEGSARTLCNESCTSGAECDDDTALERFGAVMRQVKEWI